MHNILKTFVYSPEINKIPADTEYFFPMIRFYVFTFISPQGVFWICLQISWFNQHWGHVDYILPFAKERILLFVFLSIKNVKIRNAVFLLKWIKYNLKLFFFLFFYSTRKIFYLSERERHKNKIYFISALYFYSRKCNKNAAWFLFRIMIEHLTIK